MAGEFEDRTEAATARRLSRAREEGHVPLSREVAPLASLAAATLLLMVAGPWAARATAGRLAMLLAEAHALSPAAALRLAGSAVLFGALPFVLAGALASTIAVLAQTGLLVHLPALLPDLSRLDPRQGVARLFSLASLADAGKALLKLLAAGTATWVVLAGLLPLLPGALDWTPGLLLWRTTHAVLRLLLVLLALQAAIAGIDILVTRRRHAASLRMSRQEVREEHRETEGDPHTRARIRRLRHQRARRRMMDAVPKAAVVVTNPTHYAVALAYQRGSAAAPRVVAKGMDDLAQRIREVAREAGVPLVANPPLARALHAVELDAEIPRELYQAVAELIAYVWRLRARVL